MKKGKIYSFDVIKNLSYTRALGSGGTGETHLFYEKLTDTEFAIKKFEPSEDNDSIETFTYFIEEIKILFRITHQNIVRVFNYYLYEKSRTGYIQMEYIEGLSIDTYVCNNQTLIKKNKLLEKLFVQTIDAFSYLENQGILHRDIRPSNIMVDSNHDIKIIDFGFSKILGPEKINNSVILNWPVTVQAEEVALQQDYTHATEIYYLGAMFTEIILQNDLNFKYRKILEKMFQVKVNNRYSSFKEIMLEIKTSKNHLPVFSSQERQIYDGFIKNLSNIIVGFQDDYSFEYDYNKIITRLNEFVQDNTLATFIPNNSLLIDCFVNGRYTYKPNYQVGSNLIINFVQMIEELDEDKTRMVFNNLFNKLATIIVTISVEDLPF